MAHGESEFIVRGTGWLSGAKDVEATMVKVRNGTPVLVKNVARVVESFVPRRGTVGRDLNLDSIDRHHSAVADWRDPRRC